jgi:hypothetical protein
MNGRFSSSENNFTNVFQASVPESCAEANVMTVDFNGFAAPAFQHRLAMGLFEYFGLSKSNGSSWVSF